MNRFSKKLVVFLIVCIIGSTSLFARSYRRTWIRPYFNRPVVTTVRYSTPEVFVYSPYTVSQPVVYTNPVVTTPVVTTPVVTTPVVTTPVVTNPFVYTNPLYYNDNTYQVIKENPSVYNNVTINSSSSSSSVSSTNSSSDIQKDSTTRVIYKSNIADVEFKDGKVNVIFSSSKPIDDKAITVTLSTADSSVSENIALQSGIAKNLGNDMYMITFIVPDSLKNFVNQSNYKISFTGKIGDNYSISGTKSVLNISK